VHAPPRGHLPWRDDPCSTRNPFRRQVYHLDFACELVGRSMNCACPAHALAGNRRRPGDEFSSDTVRRHVKDLSNLCENAPARQQAVPAGQSRGDSGRHGHRALSAAEDRQVIPPGRDRLQPRPCAQSPPNSESPSAPQPTGSPKPATPACSTESRTPSVASRVDAEPNSTTSRPSKQGANGSLFYSESEAAARLGLHRTTLRALALAGRAPVEPIPLTEHRRVYRRTDIHRLAGLEQ